MGKSKELAELGDVVTQSGGNVGIGADSPTEALHIAKAFPAVKLDNIDAGGHSWRIASGSTNSGFAGKLQIYNEDTSTIAAYIDASGRVTKPYHPYFLANLSSSFYLNRTSVETTIPFDSVYVNNGSHFNTSTHRFTAPVSGLYQFDCHVEFTSASVFDSSYWVYPANFYVNGVIQTSDDSYFTSVKYQHFNTSCILYLAANEYVEIKAHANGNYLAYGGSNRANTRFSGYLIG